MQLSETIKGMLSDNKKENLRAEAQQLYIRMNELEDLINSENLSAVYDRQTLEFQHRFMSGYFQMLLTRAKMEQIDLRFDEGGNSGIITHGSGIIL